MVMERAPVDPDCAKGTTTALINARAISLTTWCIQAPTVPRLSAPVLS